MLPSHSLKLLLVSLITTLGLSLSPRVDAQDDEETAPVRIVLAGDSTVTADAGWGLGFAELLTEPAECVNHAQSGRRSRSYRTEGWWQKCLDEKPDYLLLQFGHNDQPGKGPERESAADGAFREHLRAYVDEAKALGIRPVLVTSLTRRRWTDDGRIEPTLSAYAQATTAVAQETNVPLIDLHALSIRQCEQLGATAYRAFEPMTKDGADQTHLNRDGSRAVGALVASALIEAVPETAPLFSLEKVRAAQVPQEYSRQLTRGILELVEDDATVTIRQSGRILLTYNKLSPPLPDGMDPAYRRTGFLHPVASHCGDPSAG
jgi:lysophospholipase L1-like esterase